MHKFRDRLIALLAPANAVYGHIWEKTIVWYDKDNEKLDSKEPERAGEQD